MLAAGIAAGGPAHAADKWWVGGGIGLGFGDVTFVTVEPMVGYRAAKRVTIGGGPIFRYRSDDRVSPSLDTTDYGAAIFGRYHVTRPVFVQLEYQYLSYERLFTGGSTDRSGYNSLFGGAGFSQPVGKNVSFFVTAMYNFLYERNEPSPYDEPWVLRAGVGFHF